MIGIVHLHRGSAVEHQVGNGFLLYGCLRARITVENIVPVDDGACGYGFHLHLLRSVAGIPLRSTGIGRDGLRGFCHRRIPMVIHHLSHSRSNASRDSFPARGEKIGTALVIRICLVPGSGQQRSDGGMCDGRQHGWLKVVFLHVPDLPLVLCKPRFHVGRQ